MFDQAINKFTYTPNALFLIDALGAALSAMSLGIALPVFHGFIGMPVSSLYLLAIFPCIFMLFDLIVYFRINTTPIINLKRIAYLNLAYVILSLCLMYHHFQSLTILGKLYFGLEITIILALVWLELKVANSLDNSNKEC